LSITKPCRFSVGSVMALLASFLVLGAAGILYFRGDDNATRKTILMLTQPETKK
jgi:hypothetical protein